ncbi:MAG: DsbA family protein [Pseudobdellovibrionaceae bacterium]
MTSEIKITALSILMAAFLGQHALGAEYNGAVIAGPDDAPVTIEEYADFQCSYCARGADTMAQVLKDYPREVKLVFRNLPLDFHSNALNAAKAFSAIYLQNRNLAYRLQEELFSHQDQFEKQGVNYIYSLAEKIGVNMDRMKDDMNSDNVEKMLKTDHAAAVKHNFQGTPSFLIGSEPVTGARPYDELKKIIDRQLKTTTEKF